jgi:hypothetical protein
MAGLDDQIKKRREAAAATPGKVKPEKTAVYVDPGEYHKARIWCATHQVTYTALMSVLLHRHLESNEATQVKVAAEAKLISDPRGGAR